MDKYPSQPNSSEQAPRGTHIFVEQKEEIFQAISENPFDSITLAKVSLEQPIKTLRVVAYSEPSSDSDHTELDLMASLQYNSTGRKRIGGTVLKKIVSSLPEHPVQELGGNYIINGTFGTRLVLGYSEEMDLLWLSNGTVIDEEEDEEEEAERLFDAPELTEQNLEDALNDYSYMLEQIIATSYETAKKSTPDRNITIKPPKNIFKNLGWSAILGSQTETGEDITKSLEANISGITFDSIGGQRQAKEELQGLVFAISNPELYRTWGTSPPKGVLLEGPPGTGKTLLAMALASEADARFLHVKASDIGSKWYGESEQKMQSIFSNAAKDDKKTIIYFDEIDTLVPRRDGSHEATQKVTGVLLQNMDGIGASDNVMVIASTNRKDAIDDAMTRPGRLDRLIKVPLPDERDRREILGVHTGKANAVASAELFDALDIDALARVTKGYSGADIAEIVRRTLEAKVRLAGSGQDVSPVQTSDILAQIGSYEHVRKNASERMGFRT